jgi:hypothetical protein
MGAAPMTVSETRERLRRIAAEEQRQNLMGYSADGGYARHRLENQRHEGTPIASAKVPRTVVMEQDEQGKWWANKPAFGPFDTVRDLELAVYGRSELSSGKRDWRDDARPSDE